MRKPDVSFVIPVYKKDPDVFRLCLKSLFDQSLKEFEVICVFDGPDEELLKVAKDFKVQMVEIDHSGAPAARNAGLRYAKGEFVVFWDADCYIKPEAAKRWLMEFEVKPEVDFVYTDYELTGERGGHQAEPFDHYSLTCGNYICTMSPIRREKAPLWDETLHGAQDWDYFLTACEKGLKGSYIPGSAFSTEADGVSISSKAWNAENRKETIRKIKEKHGIPDRRIGVFSHQFPDRALKIAKILEADLIRPSGKNADEYDIVFLLDYGLASRWEGFSEKTVKIQYWIPSQIEQLTLARYASVMETIRIAKGCKNFCNTEYEKNRLSEFGITAEVVPLPLAEEDLTKVSNVFPEKFKVLLVTDEAYGKLLTEIPQDLPHIEFVHNQANVKDFSCLMSFYRFAALDDAILIAHINGRNVISNVQAPYCGYIDPDQDYDKFKQELYEKIRELREKPYNAEAREFYLEMASPAKFKDAILGLSKTLEVV